MVAIFEIAFLIACLMLVVWWFRRTNMYRSRRRSGVDPAQYGGAAGESLRKNPPKSGPSF
jgi:hypothetical protein